MSTRESEARKCLPCISNIVKHSYKHSSWFRIGSQKISVNEQVVNKCMHIWMGAWMDGDTKYVNGESWPYKVAKPVGWPLF